MKRYLKVLPILAYLFLMPGLALAGEVLTWHDCVAEAAKNHPDLIAAVEEIKQSESAKKITASTLFPQVTGSVSASTAKTASQTSGSSTGNTYGYGVTGTQLIFDGNKTVNDVKAASQNIAASKQNYRFTSVTVRYRLRSAFISLLKAQEMLQITNDIFNIRRENLELISLRYESGLEHKGALLTAEADLAQAKYLISQAKRDVEVARRELTKEMGRDKMVELAAKGEFVVNDSAKDEPDFESLAKNNPSLQQLIAQKNSAEFSLKSVYANFSPTLSGQAGANRTGSHWEPRGDQWNLGATISLPIFEGGLRLAQVSQAKALLNQLKENERSTKDSVVLTLQQTWALLQDAIENVSVQKKSLEANEERSKIAQAQYSIGLIDFNNWTIIEDNLVQAKRTYLDAQANALFAEAGWIQAKGETIEYE